ncbi:MAG: hypothetical protein JSS53_07250 [Proteobacteria bacterium]|nr:hypothetical protein [Pseudomonadota bacterium]
MKWGSKTKSLEDFRKASTEDLDGWLQQGSIKLDTTFTVKIGNTKVNDLSLIAIAALDGNTKMLAHLLLKSVDMKRANKEGVDIIIAATFSNQCERVWQVIFGSIEDATQINDKLLAPVNQVLNFWLVKKHPLEALKELSLKNMFSSSLISLITYDLLKSLYQSNRHLQLPNSVLEQLNNAFLTRLKVFKKDEIDDAFILALLNHIKSFPVDDAIFIIEALASQFLIRNDNVNNQLLEFLRRYEKDIYIVVLLEEFVFSKIIGMTDDIFYQYLKKTMESINAQLAENLNKLKSCKDSVARGLFSEQLNGLDVCGDLVLQRLQRVIDTNPSIGVDENQFDEAIQAFENWNYLAKEYQKKTDPISIAAVRFCYQASLSWVMPNDFFREKILSVVKDIDNYLVRIKTDEEGKFSILVMRIEFQIIVSDSPDIPFLMKLFFESTENNKQRFINLITDWIKSLRGGQKNLFAYNYSLNLLHEILNKVATTPDLFQFYHKIAEGLYNAQYCQEALDAFMMMYQRLMKIDLKSRPTSHCDSCITFIEDHAFDPKHEYARKLFLSECYSEKNDYKKALEYYSETLELARQLNDEGKLSFTVQALLEIAKSKKQYQALIVVIEHYMQTQQFSLAAITCIDTLENEEASVVHEAVGKTLETLLQSKNLIAIAYHYSKLPEKRPEDALLKLSNFLIELTDFQDQKNTIPPNKIKELLETYFNMGTELLEKYDAGAKIALNISGALGNGRALLRLADLFSEKLELQNYDLILNYLGMATLVLYYPQGQSVFPFIQKLLEATEIEIEDEIYNRIIQALVLAIYQQINLNYQSGDQANWQSLLGPISITTVARHEAASFFMWIYLRNTLTKASHVIEREAPSLAMENYLIANGHVAQNNIISAYSAYSKFLSLLGNGSERMLLPMFFENLVPHPEKVARSFLEENVANLTFK